MNRKFLFTVSTLTITLIAISIFIYFSKICFKNTVCVYTNEEGNQVEFYTENLKDFDITLTLYISKNNLVASSKIPFTETIVANSGKVKLLQLSVKDDKKKWKYKYHYYWTVGNRHAVHDDDYIYGLPFENGTTRKVIQGFKGTLSHQGDSQYAVDFEMEEGTPIHAAREGKVVGSKSSSENGGPNRDFIDFENYIFIKHDDRTIGKYLHLKKDGVLVKVGDKVARGQIIGYSGNTGFSTKPHLHFGVYKSIDGLRAKSLPIKLFTERGIIEEPIENETYKAK